MVWRQGSLWPIGSAQLLEYRKRRERKEREEREGKGRQAQSSE